MKKKALALLLATSMVATLVGCGDKTTAPEATETDADTTEDEPAEENTEETTEETTEEEAITTTLTVWSPAEDQDEENGNWLNKMCEQFKAEHPNWDITFEYGVCGEADAKTTVTQDVEGAADVYMFANDNLPELVANNGISQLGGEAADYVKSTNSETIVDSVSLDGKVYGVPFTTNTWFMYYDKSAFTEEEANSLDAMIAKEKVAFPLSNSWYIASFFVANDCTLFGDGTDEEAGIDFGGEKGAQVASYLVDLVNNPNFVNDANSVGISGLREGTIKAIFSGSWDATAAKEALGDNFAAKALPTVKINGTDKQMMSFSGSKAIGVNPNCEYPQVAVALAKYLGGVDAQKSHYELRNIVPCNTELLADEAVSADALVVAQNETFESTSIIQPFVSKMSNYWSPAENFGRALINKEVTADNAADKAEELNTALNTSAAE